MNTRIRLALIVLPVIVLFWVLGMPLTSPVEPRFPHAVLTGPAGLPAALFVLAGGLVGVALGAVLGGPQARVLAPAALPAGIAVWAVSTSGLKAPLLQAVTPAARAAIFRGMVVDAVFLTLVVIAAALAARWLRHHYKPQVDGSWREELAHDWPGWRDALAGAGLITVVAAVMLMLTARAGQVAIQGQAMSPALRPLQGAFAAFVSFYLGALLAKHVLKPSLWFSLLAPGVVAVVFYVYAGGVAGGLPSGQTVGALLPTTIMPGAIPPTQYLGLGSLAILLALGKPPKTIAVR